MEASPRASELRDLRTGASLFALAKAGASRVPWGKALLASTLLLLAACGVKAPPQPPELPAARRGVEPPPCPGCRIPAPDTLPSPSVPSKVVEEEASEEEEQAPGAPVLPGEGAPTEPLPGTMEEPEAESPPAAE